ncbi:MAG TPA: glycosyltransferase family 39 protein, partial [Thermoanaerobaculia bacterium]|nr:glycosyltransferase family 39 protein [Thermoanaerobaculia bacterium]
MRTSERILLAGAAAVSLALRAVAFFRYRFDSDEPQHLHVAWGWTAGLVQYRDYFDNHAPLFHLLTAPLLKALGERADILLWMRAPMLILFAAVLYATYVIGRAMYDERTALWGVVLLSLFPPFFLKSLEYRTDNLWNTLWMLALLALMRRRYSLAGLLLGAALGVSLKTTLLLATLGIAALIATHGRGKRNWQMLVPFAIGFAIIPALLLAFFALMHAWDAMVYCVFTFNANVSQTRGYVHLGRYLYPFALAGVIFAAWRFRAMENRARYFAAVATGIFIVTLGGFWILISPRDFLPIMP